MTYDELKRLCALCWQLNIRTLEQLEYVRGEWLIESNAALLDLLESWAMLKTV